MTTPLSAGWRLRFPYFVDGQSHVRDFWVNASPGTGTTGYNITQRDASTEDMSAVADAFWTIIAPLYQASVTAFGTVLLEQLVGSAFLPVASWITAVTPTGSGTYIKASQFSAMLRDTSFHKIHIPIYELEVTIPEKTLSPTGFGGAFSSYGTWLTTAGSIGSKNGYNWIRGRSNLYIGSFISFVATDNDRLRRDRGLA